METLSNIPRSFINTVNTLEFKEQEGLNHFFGRINTGCRKAFEDNTPPPQTKKKYEDLLTVDWQEPYHRNVTAKIQGSENWGSFCKVFEGYTSETLPMESFTWIGANRFNTTLSLDQLQKMIDDKSAEVFDEMNQEKAENDARRQQRNMLFGAAILVISIVAGSLYFVR